MDKFVINFSDINFDEIISIDSSFGIIWKGTYKNTQVAIKMVMLRKGNYYVFDKTDHDYKKHHKNKSYFEQDSSKPFLHTYFLDHKPVHFDTLENEVYSLNKFANLNLAPKLYGYCINNQPNNIFYGFIVMELLDGSVKDIIMERALTRPEKNIIYELIDIMHIKHKCVHRDLKPSNIGMFLDNNKQIIRCVLIDLQSAVFKKHLELKRYQNRDKEFEELIEHDWFLYNSRYKANKKNRKY